MQFLDFLVDGRPLRDLLEVPDDTKQPTQETTALRDDHNWPSAAVEQLDRLLGVLPGDFDDGRIALLMCTACGDLACGAVSMELVQTPQTITWQRFGWQDGVTDEPQPWLFPEQSFTFDQTDYEHLLRSLQDRYRSLPPQEPSAPNRRSLEDCSAFSDAEPAGSSGGSPPPVGSPSRPWSASGIPHG
ncbi:hypothetical protein GCM10023081_00250 [Arthrobacter ginkgonis]|uniref:Uncharacterized protein n=1 Tax=Arthrobacter ginkgonis TaxID=1630594 RepID=A0ABP7BMN6_9MICC